ncbi:MAG TPA: hypothetical protein PK733_03800, partial [Clostridiales bacterium]|nr:hypothetical protein [Clostridiales bacterium]
EGRLDTVDSRLAAVEGRLGTVDSRLDALDSRLDTVEGRLDTVYEQTAMLTEFRAEVNQKLQNMADNITSIVEITGEHEIQIRNIKRKVV